MSSSTTPELMPQSRLESKDGIELNWSVNYIAPVLLTELLLRRMTPARIINVTSQNYRKANFELKDYEPRRAHGNSKFALLLYTRLLAKRVPYLVNAVCPGQVRTNLHRKDSTVKELLHSYLYMKSPARSAKTILFLATDPNLTSTGQFFTDGKVTPTLPI